VRAIKNGQEPGDAEEDEPTTETYTREESLSKLTELLARQKERADLKIIPPTIEKRKMVSRSRNSRFPAGFKNRSFTATRLQIIAEQSERSHHSLNN